MAPIKTYVFFDLEATGLIEGTDIPAITELGMLAVKRRHLLSSTLTDELTVDKFVMSFNPHRALSQVSVTLSGLNNELLEDAAEFDIEAFNAINSFINCLQKPVCMIAHKGFEYHFIVVKSHFLRMGTQLAEDVKCGDSLYAFYDLLEEENRRRQEEEEEREREEDDEEDENNLEEKSFEDLKRAIFFYPNHAPADSYSLSEIYQRDVGPDLITNRAENHCTMMLQIAQKRAQRFCQWVDVNYCPFSEVPTE